MNFRDFLFVDKKGDNEIARKSFNEKLHANKDMPQVKEIDDPKTASRYGGSRMLIAAPLEIDELMKQVPKGALVSNEQICRTLAKKHNADFTCPLTAGIFIGLSAQASLERGFDEIPYWRTVKAKGELNPKYPGEAEGKVGAGRT